MNVVTPLIPPFNADFSKLGYAVSEIKLWLKYSDNQDDLGAATGVWTDFTTNGNNWKNGTLQITDLGFNTVGDLLTALGITIEDASDNQLILVLPMVVSASQSENNNQRILSITFPDGVTPSGVLTDEKSVSLLTNENEGEGNVHLREDNDSVIGFHIEGTSLDDTIITGPGSDHVTASSGDDEINLGENGNQGNWWSDRDLVEYAGTLNVLDRSTGAYVRGYDITQNEDGSVTVTDLLGDGLNDQGTDTLYGVEELQFGNSEWVQLGVRKNVHHWGGADWRERRLNVDGGVFDDVITGSEFNDNRGRSGDDIIIADGDAPTYGSLRISGGHDGDIARDVFGGNDGFKDILVQLQEGLSKSFDGKQKRVLSSMQMEITIQSIRMWWVNRIYTNAVDYSLPVGVTEAALAELVAELRASGENIHAEVFVKDENTATYYLLDVTVDDTFRSGDWIEGGEGNDFIDGGLTGTSTENQWKNWNKSNAGRCQISTSSKLYESDATSFNDGTLVSEYAALFSLEAATGRLDCITWL